MSPSDAGNRVAKVTGEIISPSGVTSRPWFIDSYCCCCCCTANSHCQMTLCIELSTHSLRDYLASLAPLIYSDYATGRTSCHWDRVCACISSQASPSKSKDDSAGCGQMFWRQRSLSSVLPASSGFGSHQRWVPLRAAPFFSQCSGCWIAVNNKR